MTEDPGGGTTPPPASAWPPTDAPTAFVPELPSPAFVLSRVRASAVVALVALPVVFMGTYGRLFRNGLPISRLINPGVIGVVAVTTVALAAILGPRVGRPSVVAGADWVAGRGLFGGRWRMVPLGQADRFSRRVVRSRSRTNTVLTIAGPAGQRVGLTFALGDPALDEVLAALHATGAREEPMAARGGKSRTWVVAVSALLIAVFSLPAVYLEAGPLRLLPRSVAGAFSWSGCRAALAAETDHPTSAPSFVTNPLSADGVGWRLLGEQRLDAAQFAQRTEHPADRLTHLQADGFLTADQAYLTDPRGHVVAFTTLRFAEAGGALAYDRYVNRAVCEHEYGRHGPRPTEVRLFHGKGALARWVAGNALDEVEQTRSRPFATKAEIYAVAAAIGG
jgi:hypothetical protein